MPPDEMVSKGTKVHKKEKDSYHSRCPVVQNIENGGPALHVKKSWWWKDVTCLHCLKRKKGEDWKRRLQEITKKVLAEIPDRVERKPAKVGSRVEILTPVSGLKHRENKNGKIVEINGGYVYVQPMWCTWQVELYHGEFRVL